MEKRSPKYLLELPWITVTGEKPLDVDAVLRKSEVRFESIQEVPPRKPLTLAIVAWTFIFAAVFAAILYFAS